MSRLSDAVSGFVAGLRGQRVPVTDTLHVNPTQASVPHSWSGGFMGPGAPVTGILSDMTGTAREKDAQTEPRTFSYPPNVNATLSPRAAYGLMAFSDLREAAETVPEVGTCIRILTEELKSFEPRIVDENGAEYHSPETDWMIRTPDRMNSWPVWLSRFMYNTLVYDAAAVHRPRNRKNNITAMRVIDGSTIFAMVDERGEQPRPPAPAFCQIIYGIPRMYLNTHLLWYHPRHLRADAPYGRSPIEDALPAVRTLSNLWSYEESWYTEGTTAEQILTAPENWTVDQILAFEASYNARMAGNTAERAGRVRFVPAGTTSVATKDAVFRQDMYQAAANSIRMAFGIPQTEFGESPSAGLGGSGFLEAMQNLFYRLGIAPNKAYIEALINETLRINGHGNLRMEMAFPKESLDPKKEEERILARWNSGLIRLDEARQSLGHEPIGGEEGNTRFSGGQAGQDPLASRFGSLGSMIPVREASMIPVSGNRIPVSSRIPVRDEEEGIHVKKGLRKTWTSPLDDVYFGAPVAVEGGKAVIGTERLPSRAAVWNPNMDGREEAVYLLDRALAPNDQRYLVPLAYQATVGEKSGVVTVRPAGRKPAANVGRYGAQWVEQAAVLDYITSAVRANDGYKGHPEEADRVILLPTGRAFENSTDGVDSPFISEWRGKPISEEMLLSLEYAAGDESLWRDIAECAGELNAGQARERARLLLQAGIMP